MKIFTTLGIITFSFLVSLNVYSQEKQLKGVLGIEWGQSVSMVTSILEKKGFIKLKDDTGNIFTGRFNGEKCLFLPYFIDGKFYKGVVVIEPPQNTALDLYSSFKEDFSEKYGKPFFDERRFKYPYEDGDGHEYTAISLNLALIAVSWFFAESNQVMMAIDHSETIRIFFTNLSLSEVQDKRDKEKREEDY